MGFWMVARVVCVLHHTMIEYNPFLFSSYLAEISDEEKARFMEIMTQIQALGGTEHACQLPADMQAFLKTKAQAWHIQKCMAPCASTKAAVQDVQLSLRRIRDEVCVAFDSNVSELILCVAHGLNGTDRHTNHPLCSQR